MADGIKDDLSKVVFDKNGKSTSYPSPLGQLKSSAALCPSNSISCTAIQKVQQHCALLDIIVCGNVLAEGRQRRTLKIVLCNSEIVLCNSEIGSKF